jgi:DNA-directed RNA polymerase specialized sigma24 family protein
MSAKPPGANDDAARVEDLFHDAADLPPAARRAYLDAACGADHALRRRVEALFAAEEGGGQLLEPLPVPDDAERDALDRLRSRVFDELDTGGAPSARADRLKFFRAAGAAMQRSLADDRRKRRSTRAAAAPRDGDLVEAMMISSILDRLAAIDERKADIVRLRYLVGLTTAATAEVLGLSTAHVRREWVFTKAWLHRELAEGDTEVHGSAHE